MTSEAISKSRSGPIPDPQEVLGRVPTGRSLYHELAAAARSRGCRSTVADAIAETHAALSEIDVPATEMEHARRRLAEATGEEERLKERVAAARGDLRGRRAVDAPTEEARLELRAAAAALSEAQTERIAAEQAFEHERRRAMAARDARERRLRLRDRLDNRRRAARVQLAREVYPTFRMALAAVPAGDPDEAGTEAGEYAGSELAASLAAVRIAELEGPVTLSERAVAAFATASPAEARSVVPPQRSGDDARMDDEPIVRAERILGVSVEMDDTL
ncbi:DUF7856 family protein [Halorubrum vacuolatum]|uniref:Uncharacterized protein n=1 Tax=Halorubrum vacuolatum TaxID=63740 RepID=A0A238WR98_HALVU|nr:hypothetical protein [Halorubrum vacuolatum]SNR49042.1 hypothetical protein SAMN06264855_109105 [Halorubrum vacuolatum]